MNNTKGGRPRKVVREIPCDSCHNLFGQTAHEIARSVKICPACAKTSRILRPKKEKISERTNRTMGLEIVLPRTRKPHLCRHRNEWFMKVRVRKRNSGEKLTYDKIWLGVFADADALHVQQAFTATFARLQNDGHSDRVHETVQEIRRKKNDKERTRKSWEEGAKFRSIGINRVVVKRVMFTLHLPDPLMDDKLRYLGRFDTKAEAKAARKVAYKEMVKEILPCACCGKLPIYRRGMLTHIASDCDNVVQFPTGVRQLLQTKMWNLIFSKGENPPGKLTPRRLLEMGYLFIHFHGKHYYVRNDVEKDFSLASKYAVKPLEDEDAMFE